MTRYPSSVARYHMLHHGRGHENPRRSVTHLCLCFVLLYISPGCRMFGCQLASNSEVDSREVKTRFRNELLCVKSCVENKTQLTGSLIWWRSGSWCGPVNSLILCSTHSTAAELLSCNLLQFTATPHICTETIVNMNATTRDSVTVLFFLGCSTYIGYTKTWITFSSLHFWIH